MSRRDTLKSFLDNSNDNEELVNQYKRRIAGDMDLSCQKFLHNSSKNQVVNLLEETKEGLNKVSDLNNETSSNATLLEAILNNAKSIKLEIESKNPNLLKNQRVEEFILDTLKDNFSVFLDRKKTDFEQNKKQKIEEEDLAQLKGKSNTDSPLREQEQFKEFCGLSEGDLEQLVKAVSPELLEKMIGNVANNLRLLRPSKEISNASSDQVFPPQNLNQIKK